MQKLLARACRSKYVHTKQLNEVTVRRVCKNRGGINVSSSFANAQSRGVERQTTVAERA